MLLGILTLITALSISAVAIYYSVAGLVAIFAAAAVPIMIMGGTLEIAKLVTAVWLHRYWKQTVWWLKGYLTLAVIVLMLITSMGIFGFLSKAHIEQTSASQESVAQVERLTTEIARQEGIVVRAQERIENLQSTGTGSDANIQNQIDKEQERIDLAFERIQPAIGQQNQIIADARENDNNRTKPFETQLTNILDEISRLETTAREYEDKIANLSADTSAVDPLLEQIDAIEQEIIRVTNQVNSGERDQIRAGQAIIGVTSDGAFGSNTRKALVAWVAAQRERITQIQGEVSQLRVSATSTVDSERERLAGIVKDIRTSQIPALKDRELTMLGKIDEVRQTESPIIATARDEIQRLRESAETQVAQSQALIERLRAQLAQEDKAAEIDAAIEEQNDRIRTANAEIDTLTEEKYALEAEYRKLEAEVGPVKYIAEFVYGEQTDTDMLEEAVRWVILIIIFVFDPLAVLLLIASQYTFEFNKKRKDDQKELLRQAEWKDHERQREHTIVDNSSFNIDDSTPPTKEEEVDDNGGTVETITSEHTTGTGGTRGDTAKGMAVATEEERQLDEEVEQRTALEEDAEVAQEDVTPVGTEEESESTEDTQQDNPEDTGIQQGEVDDTQPTDDTPSESRDDGQNVRDTDATELQENDVVDNERDGETSHESSIQTGQRVANITRPIPLPSDEVVYKTGYVQNAEQSPDSLWNKVQQPIPPTVNKMFYTEEIEEIQKKKPTKNDKK